MVATFLVGGPIVSPWIYGDTHHDQIYPIGDPEQTLPVDVCVFTSRFTLVYCHQTPYRLFTRLWAHPFSLPSGSLSFQTLVGREENALSRRLTIQDQQSVLSIQSDPVMEPEGSTVILDAAVELYGAEARTAVAYCGLDAWFEGKEDEFRKWASLFKQFSN